MSEQNPTGRVTTLNDVLIIFLFLLTVVVITFMLTDKYPTATDAAALAGVIFPSITAIAAAAFGISQAIRASAAEQKVEKAENALLENKQVVKKVFPVVAALKKDLSAAETKDSVYNKGFAKGPEAFSFDFESINRKVSEIESMLEQIE